MVYSLRHRSMLIGFVRMNYDDFFFYLHSIQYYNMYILYNPISINPFLLFSIFLPSKKKKKKKNEMKKRKRKMLHVPNETAGYLLYNTLNSISLRSLSVVVFSIDIHFIFYYYFLIMQREKNQMKRKNYMKNLHIKMIHFC